MGFKLDQSLILLIALCYIASLVQFMTAGTVDRRPVQTLDHRHKNVDNMMKDRPEDQQSLSHFQNKAKLHTYQHDQLMQLQIQVKQNLTSLGLGS